MSDVLKAAFLFIAPEADPETHRQWVKTPAVHVLSIAVGSYDQAVETAKKLVAEEGIAAFELCGGFGNRGTAMVAEAVDVPVGVIRFDIHPGLGNVSGDTLF
ncbi:MAG: DUF6506 family protein [Desulfovibrio sp.]|uniref:DUF6506 family protein n=1 Tax=Desulfovibrio sp. 7SRBS1 TaxID=3378064 RepID=UPI003B414B42